VFHVHGLDTPDPDWGLHIGDCLHKARSALDHLMVRLVAFIRGEEPRDVSVVQFPIHSDPTRYEGAVTASTLLPNSRLLTVHAWGHTSLFRSQCADEVASDYLVNLVLPPEGTVCEQDHVPFSGP